MMRTHKRLSIAIALSALALAAPCVAPIAAQTTSTPSPWTVTLAPRMQPLPIGVCGAVLLTLADSASKNAPRNPQGILIGIADFDMTVAGATATDVVGQQNGPTNWSVCACQSATVGSSATITASYPARALAARDRVRGVQFTATAPVDIAKAMGSVDPASCTSSQLASRAASTAATAPTQQGTLVTAQPLGAALPGTGVPGKSLAKGGAGVGLLGSSPPSSSLTLVASGSTMTLGGSSFDMSFVEGGGATVDMSTSGGVIARTGSISYDPIVVIVQPGGQLDPWINASWAGTATPMSGAISYQTSYTSQEQLQFSNARLASTTISFVSGLAKSRYGVRLLLVPAQTSEGTAIIPLPSFAASSAPKWQPDRYVFSIPTVSTAGVTDIAPFEVSPPRALPAPSVGKVRVSATGTAVVQSMFVTIKEAQAADWFAWHNASVTGGTSSEKTFTLDLLSQIPGTRMARLSATGVGIVALRRLPAQSKLVQAELYVKQIALIP